MAQHPNPTAARLLLAGRLKSARLAAGKSADDAAQAILGDRSKVSRLESGNRAATRRDLRDLARLYGLSDPDLEELEELAAEARKKGWWHDYRSEDDQAASYLDLEFTASRMHMLENLRWPGMLQTAAMTRAFLGGLRPDGELSAEFIEDQVTVRAARKKRLLDGEIRFDVVLDEAMFEPRMDPPVLRDQVAHMIDLAELPNATIQVVPYNAGVYPGLDGTFNILDFDLPLKATVFVEGLLGNHLLSDDETIKHYRTVFTSVSTTNAFAPDESLAWLKKRITHY